MVRLPRLKQATWRVLALLGVLAVAVGIFWVLTPHGANQVGVLPPEKARAARPAQPPVHASDARSLGNAAPTPSGSPSPTPHVPPLAEEEEIFDAKAAIAMTRELIEDYRRRAEFPPDSRPIHEAQDPILAEREISPIEAGGPEGEEPILTVLPDRLVFEAPERAVIYGYLTAGGQRVPAREMVGTILSESLHEIGTLRFRDDGQQGDAQAGDGIYTATVIPPVGAEAAGSYLVRVVAFSMDGAERRAGTSFQYSRPGARPTGQFRDRLEGGSLVIEVQLAVDRAGIFHLSGSLYDANGRPIGVAQNRAELEAGEHWVPLRYYGRMFHSDARTGRSAADGPYQLRFLSLLNATQMPNAMSRLWDVAYWTQAYGHAQFTSEPFNDPFYLEAIAREEAELKRLEALQSDAGAQ